MPSRWDIVHAGLALSIRSEKSAQVFRELKLVHGTPLADFADGAALVDKLVRVSEGRVDVDSGLDLDRKDRILGALVGAAARPGMTRLAIELLLLALWPGLSGVFRRLSRLYRQRPDDLAVEILDRFTVCVRRLDLRRCTRVAATLVRNTQRVVSAARLAELRRAALGQPPTSEWDAMADQLSEHAAALVDLRAWLRDVVPRDADLVIGVLVGGQNCREAGAQLGISHASARQRLARARARIRLYLS
jgi:DNA-directed RNA polymerase specialized sigma24 family protein